MINHHPLYHKTGLKENDLFHGINYIIIREDSLSMIYDYLE